MLIPFEIVSFTQFPFGTVEIAQRSLINFAIPVPFLNQLTQKKDLSQFLSLLPPLAMFPLLQMVAGSAQMRIFHFLDDPQTHRNATPLVIALQQKLGPSG